MLPLRKSAPAFITLAAFRTGRASQTAGEVLCWGTEGNVGSYSFGIFDVGQFATPADGNGVPYRFASIAAGELA